MTRAPIASLIAIILLAGSSMPAAAADTDKDGLRDGWEKRYGVTSYLKRDTDGDGVIDSAEDNDGDRLGNLGEQRWKTNPKKKDTDGDGTGDGAEDKNGNGISNAREQDRRRVPAGLKPSLTNAKKDFPRQRAKCLTMAGQSRVKRCWFGKKGANKRVALIGDSHALMWLPAAVRAANQRGWRVISLLKGGCSPLLGTMNEREWDFDRGTTCRTWRRSAYDWIKSHKIDLVIVAHADSYPLVDGKGRKLGGAAKFRKWRTGVLKTIRDAKDPAKMVLLGDVPRNRLNPTKCLRSSPGNISRCVSPRETWKQRKVERVLRKATADAGGQFRTVFSKICSYDPCPVVQGNITMWRDKHHVTATFARKLAPSFRELMAAGIAAGAGGAARRDL